MCKHNAVMLLKNNRGRIRAGAFSVFLLGICLLYGLTLALGQQSEAAMPMPLVAPLFIEDDERTSVITMVNDAPDPLELDVTLFGLSGDQLAKKTVAMGPHTEQMVAVKDLLSDVPHSSAMYGSILLSPYRKSTMGAQLSISGRDGASTNDIEEEFVMLTGSQPADYRAVTVASAPLIAVRSLSADEQTLLVECMGGEGRKHGNGALSIAPNQTLLVQACTTAGPRAVPGMPHRAPHRLTAPEAVAMTVSSPAAAMEFAVFGVGVSDARGGLAAIPFVHANDLRSSTAVYPGIAPGGSIAGVDFKLQAAIANFGSTPRMATVLLSAGPGGQRPISTVNLAPGSVSVLDLNDMPGNGDASILVQTDGAPGEVLSNIHLVSASKGAPLSVPLAWKDQSQIPNGGQHPWRIDGGFKSAVVLYNPDSESANSVELSIYGDNRAWRRRVAVAPLSTVAIRINDIIIQQHMDDKGNTLSRESTHGMVSWFTLAKPKILGYLAQSDAISGVVRPFACAQTYAVCGIWVDSATVGVGGFTSNLPANTSTCGTNGNCDCVESCVSGPASLSSFSWSSSNSSVASLVSNPSANYGQYQGVSPGSTSSDVFALDNLGCPASGGGPLASCSLAISPGQFNVACNAGSNDRIYNVTTNPTDSCLMTGTPTCSATKSGTVDWDVSHTPNPSCSVVGGVFSGHVYMFAGAAGDTTGTITGHVNLSVEVTVNGTRLSKGPQDIPVVCQ